MTSTLPLLRLLQITDSAFPVGGFAYSHGLEWLAARRIISGEQGVGSVLDAYLRQVGGGQWFPAARAACDAKTERQTVRADTALDASIASSGERDASRAMGERLLSTAADGIAGRCPARYRELVHAGSAPGHYPIAFALVARDEQVGRREVLSALGLTMASSITQAAIRLGLIGQAAAVRLVAASSVTIDEQAERVLAAQPRRVFGAFAPGLEVATMLQPNLPFRMFAS